MADRFSQQSLRVAIAQLCQSVGWHAIQTSSSDVLVELLEHYLLNLGKKTADYCNHANRTEPSTIDVFHAFEEVGVSLRELLEYFNGMEVDAQFDPAVPSFPVHKAQSHVHSGLGTRILRKSAGITGTRLPSGGKKEGGSAGEGDAEDMDVDESDDKEEEEEDVWEEIPGYLPPLPKPEEETGLPFGGDNGDDAESGIHVSEGEASPLTLKSPLGQSGLPTLFRRRSQSISEEDAPSRGSSVSDETMSSLPSKDTGGLRLSLKSEDTQDKSLPSLSLQANSQLHTGVGTTKTQAHSRTSPTSMLVDNTSTAQVSKPVVEIGIPSGPKPLPQHTPKPKPNLRIDTGVGVAVPSVTTPTIEDLALTRQGSPGDPPRLPTLHRITSGGGVAKGSFYPPHTPALSPLLGTSPTSPQVSVATRPVLHPLMGSPVGFSGKHPARTLTSLSPVSSGPLGTSPVEKDTPGASSKVSSSASIPRPPGGKSGEPPAMQMPRLEGDESATSIDTRDQQEDSSVSEGAVLSPGSSPRPSPAPSLSPSPSRDELVPPMLERVSPSPSPSASPSLHSLSQNSPSSPFSPSPVPSSPRHSPSEVSPSHSFQRRTPSPSPEPYSTRSPLPVASPRSSLNSSPLSSPDLSSPSPAPAEPSVMPGAPSVTVSLEESSTFSLSRVAGSPLQAMSPCSTSSSSGSSSSSVASSSLAVSDAEAEVIVDKRDSFLPSPSAQLLAGAPCQERSVATPTLPPSQPPSRRTDSLVLPCLPNRQRRMSPTASRETKTYLSSPLSDSSGSESSAVESPIQPEFVKKKSLSYSSKPKTPAQLKAQVPRLPASKVPRPPASQVPRLPSSQTTHSPSPQVPRLPPSKVPRLSLPVKAKKRRRSVSKKVRQPKKMAVKPSAVAKGKASPRLIVRIKKKLLKKEEAVKQEPTVFDDQSAPRQFPPLSSGNVKVGPIQTKRVSSIFPNAGPSRKQTGVVVASALEKTQPSPLVVSIRKSSLQVRGDVGVSKGPGKGGVKRNIPKVALEKARVPPAVAEGTSHRRGYKRELELSELGLPTSEPQTKKSRLAPPPHPLLRQPQPPAVLRRPTSSSSSSSDSSESSSESEESVASPAPAPAITTATTAATVSQAILPFPSKQPPSLSSSSDDESVESRGKLKVTLTIPKRVPDHPVVKRESAKQRRTSSRAQVHLTPAPPPSRGDKSSTHSRRLRGEQQHSTPLQQSLKSVPKQQALKKVKKPQPPSGSRAKAPPTPTTVIVSSTFTTAPPVSEGPEVCICPSCRGPDNGTPMICCDSCDIWLHLACVGLVAPPPEDQSWFCSNCQQSKKKRKRKH